LPSASKDSKTNKFKQYIINYILFDLVCYRFTTVHLHKRIATAPIGHPQAVPGVPLFWPFDHPHPHTSSSEFAPFSSTTAQYN
jgi:hypothetical protein